MDRTGLGADLKPVPTPTVRDLSVPDTSKPGEVQEAGCSPSPPKSRHRPMRSKSFPPRKSPRRLARTFWARRPRPVSKPADAKAEAAPADKPAAEAKPDPDHYRPAAAQAPRRPKPITVASTPMIGNYQLPPLDFLQHPDPTVKPTESKEELMANARLMQQTLAQFDIEVSLGDITKGPTITRYELHPAPGVKLEKITALNNNLAAALKAERIHILAPVPGKSSVGVEVPNPIKTKVIMRDLLESEEWRNTKARIPLALGKDVYGHPIIADLAEMPHLLIAGSTGSGKSVCINSIIASLLYRFSPDQLRFVMIDPKVVELQQYNALPHLVVPVVTDPEEGHPRPALGRQRDGEALPDLRPGRRAQHQVLQRAPQEQAAAGPEPELPLTAKKEKVEAGADGFAVEVDEEIVVPRDDDIVIPEKLSYIVVIIDELADLMLVAPADVEMAIARITQMARAAGIHCIVATQRPERGRHHRRHQGEHPGAHRLPGGRQGGLAHDSRRHGRRQAAGQGRHALPAARLGQADPRPGRAHHRPGNPEHRRLHRQAGQAELRAGNPPAALQARQRPRGRERHRRGRGDHPAVHRGHPQRAEGQRLPPAAPPAPRLHAAPPASWTNWKTAASSAPAKAPSRATSSLTWTVAAPMAASPPTSPLVRQSFRALTLTQAWDWRMASMNPALANGLSIEDSQYKKERLRKSQGALRCVHPFASA